MDDTIKQLIRTWKMWEDEERLARTLPPMQAKAIARIALIANQFIEHSTNENYLALFDAVMNARAIGVSFDWIPNSE